MDPAGDFDRLLEEGTAVDILEFLLPEDSLCSIDIFWNRGRAILSCLLVALVELRDRPGAESVRLTRHGLKEALTLEALAHLAWHKDLPQDVTGPIRQHLRDLPGIGLDGAPDRISEQLKEQYSFLTMYIFDAIDNGRKRKAPR